jgi:hypothetical protein
MTIRDDIIAEAKKQATNRGKLMFLGNGSVVAVPGTLNQVYATDVDGHVSVVWNKVAPNELGYPVWVKMIDKKLQVNEAWDFYNDYAIPKVGPHWWTHAWGSGGTDMVPVAGDQWTPWIVQPATTTDFTINLYRTPIYTSAGWIAGGTVTYDMASYIPGSGALYILMSVSPADGSIHFTSGSTQATPSALTIADWPVLPSGDMPLYLIMLYHGMTAPLVYTPALSNFTDLRHMEMVSTSVTPTLGANEIAYANSIGAITGNANFTYQNGVFVMGGTVAPATNPTDANVMGEHPAVRVWGYSATPAYAPSDLLIRSLGVPGSPAAVIKDTVLGRYRIQGWYDSSHQSNSTDFRAVADEDFDATHQGTRIEFWGTPNGATTPQLLATIYGDGRIVSANDIEITDATKGIILKDTVTGTRYRISVTSGALVATPA